MQNELLENSLQFHALISALDFIHLRHNVVPPLKSHPINGDGISFTFHKAHEDAL